MLILGYKLNVGGELVDVSSLFNGERGDLLIMRTYASLSPEAHLIVWTSSLDTKPLLMVRDKLRRCCSDMIESVVWLSIYKPSPYVGRSEDLMSKLKSKPLRYLVAYPMKKSPEWYLLPFDERKSIMAEHIGIARSHSYSRNIKSYTTYAFGIASYEFLVIYETPSLNEWVTIVERLREAKARRWVTLEEPVLVGEFLGGW